MPNPVQTLWPTRHVLVVVAAAVLLRIAFLALASESAFMHTPVVDASFFDIWARALAEGRGFQNQAFFKPPLYAYLLSWMYKSGLTMISIQILQMLVSLGTVLLTLAIGRLVFPARVALAGALITALLPILPFFEIQLLAETWTTALGLGSILMILMVVTGKSRSRGKLMFMAGLLMGWAALGRPNLMLLIAALVLWLWRWDRSSKQLGTRTILILGLGFLIAISPATLHNLKHGEFSLISTNLGANLVTGNSDSADGVTAIAVGVLWDDLQLRTKQAGCSNSGEASRFLTKEALLWVGSNPDRALLLLGKKIVLLFSAQEIRNNINPRWFAQNDGVFLLKRWWPGTWLMLPFAIIGLMHWRRWNPGSGLLVWVLLAQVAAVLPFFVNARFRLPLLPILGLFAAAGFAVLWNMQKAESKTTLVRYLAVLGAVFVLVNVDWFGLNDPRWLAQDYFNQGLIQSRNYQGRKADPSLAEESFRTALELDKTDVDINERLGAFLFNQKVLPLMNHAADLEAKGNLEKASSVYDRAELAIVEARRLHQNALDLFPRSFRSWANLGTGQMIMGDIYAFRCRQHLAQNNQPEARLSALQALQQYQGSHQSFKQGLQINPAQKDSRTNLSLLTQAIMRLPNLDPSIENLQTRIEKSSGS
jgi:tetratricopeptide (TPR) repeat protein